jgi:hypothetical protein
MIRLSHAAAAGAVVLALTGVVAPANAALPSSERAAVCIDEHNGFTTAARSRDGEMVNDTRDVGAAEAAAIEKQTAQIVAKKGKPAASVTVPTYVHVMAASDGFGNVTDKQVRDQIAVLNKTFGGVESPAAAQTGFTFELKDVRRYSNDTWHRDKASSSYRSETRVGGPETLNIWIVNFYLLGVATFPWDYEKSGDIDGVRIAYDTLPGVAEHNYNQGETATHEVGHWLGLYHVFQGGCEGEGDWVADTPPQSIATRGCPEGQDSCVGDGVDSIHNYMDYSYDSCYDRFSPLQSAKMSDDWLAYRAS